MENNTDQMIRSHKVGTVTLGFTLIFFGILYITKLFTNVLNYEFIFKLWPIIFIFLGSEILISYVTRQKERLVYDKGAIFLMILLTLFAIGMACVELVINYMHVYMIR